MGRNRWPTFGRDMAAANIRILRRTGKYGTLRTPDDVWAYIQEVKRETQPRLDEPANGHGTITESARATKPDVENRSNPTLAAADTHDENHSTAKTPPTTDNRSDPSDRPGPDSPTRDSSEPGKGPAAAEPDADPPGDNRPEATAGRPTSRDHEATGTTENGEPAKGRSDQAKRRAAAGKG